MPAAFRDRFRRGGDDAAGDGADFVDADDADGDRDGYDGAGEWLAYEFHEWSLESRVMLQQLLTVDQVVHSWQGTTLMVHESLEATVDSLVDEVEETERAKEAIARPIGPDEPLTAFELSEWPEALRVELMERLVQARVPHILDTGGDTDGDGDADGDAAYRDTAHDASEGGASKGDADATGGDADAANPDADPDPEREGICDLLVREADEERVEVVIDDLLAREEEADFEEMDGLEVNGLLSDLFMACDRLRRDPRDFEGIRGAMVHSQRIATVRTPFGFSAPSWRNLRNAAGELLTMLEGEDTDEEDVRELAHRMSDTLRMLI